jgi:hypothetical protein
MEYKQTVEKRTEILRDYFVNNFATCFPHLEPILDANGKVLCKPSYVVMFDLIRNAEFLRKDIINEILLNLDANELLVRKPQVVERIVEVERQPTQFEKDEAARKAKREKFEKARELGVRNRAQDNRNELDDEWDHGKARALPLTEQQIAAKNETNRRIDGILLDVMSAVGNYSGHSHARTSERRGELTTLFNQHKNKVNDVESAEKLQRTIAEKIDSYDRSSSGGIR